MPETAAPTSTRLEAFSDGVIAIIVTIMVLELKVPHSTEPSALLALWPLFASYALSFFLVAIYWMNHHHLFSFVTRVSHGVLWANNLLLFCISLIPFVTAYVGENHLSPFGCSLYAGVMFVCGLAFWTLARAIAAVSKDSAAIMARDKAATRKNMAALAIYAVASAAAWVSPLITLALIGVVAVMYAVPTVGIEPKRQSAP